jgi:hypothetical protein
MFKGRGLLDMKQAQSHAHLRPFMIGLSFTNLHISVKTEPQCHHEYGITETKATGCEIWMTPGNPPYPTCTGDLEAPAQLQGSQPPEVADE